MAKDNALQSEVDAALAQQRALRFGLSAVLVLGALLVGGATSTAIRRRRETAEALEQQTATADVLKTISRSAFDLQAVFDVVVENATKLCRGDWGYLFRKEADVFRLIASHGGTAALLEYERTHPTAISDRTLIGRVALQRKVVHIPDLFEDPNYDWPTNREHGVHTVLGVPIFRDDEVVGAIGVARNERSPFSDADIRLVQTFADQATIAMENVRLFNETKEALDRQTAISEILRAIANSPADQQPVLDAIADSAARFCGAADAVVLLARENELHVAAHHGPIPTLGQRPLALDRTAVAGRAVLERRTFHVSDVLGPEGEEFPQARARVAGTGQRALLAAPLLREAEAIGAILLRKDEPVPFTPNQIQLVEAFADQAVIAIENVRLFNQTKEALEQQTAIAGVLGAINKSRFDQQPVLQELVDRAAALCQAGYSSISLWDGSAYVTNAWSGEGIPKAYVQLMVDERRVPDRTTLIGRTALERRTIHVADVLEDAAYGAPAMQEAAGYRTMLGVPLLRDGFPVGIFALTRQEVRPFSERQIQLVETFAQQAVIAIENVRLFNETKEALKQRTATSEILRVISETLGDPQPVMQAIVDTVLAVCAADSAGFFRRSGDDLVLRAVSGVWRGLRPSGSGHDLPFHGDSIVVAALEEGRYQHVPDTSADPRYDAAAQWSRTRLAVPVLRGSEALGVIRVGRSELGGFTEREIHLVEGFAEQAAIAFENARLFNETKESLEQQRAVAEVLKTISRSVFDLQPVLDTVVEHAARLAGGDVAWLARITGEDSYRILSRYGAAFEAPAVKERWGDLATMRLATSTSVMGRLLRERVVLHIQDITAEKELWDASRLIRATKSRTVLAVPMLREGQPIGGVIVGRTTQRPFSDREIQLVQTFADQAAIAIENVRLFDETRESLERQTAVAQVLGAISQSGFELKSVLETVIEHATKLCAAQQGFIYRREGDVYRLAVAHGITPEFKAFTEANPVNPLGRGTITGRVAQDRMTVHVPDVLNDPEYTYWEAQRLGNFRALLGVPMIRNDQVIGVMLLWRTEPQPFTEEQIALVTTFANQATIAIENVRLFDETKEALDRQTALSEILKVISGSTFDLTPVAETVVERAARLCEADYAWIFLPERGQTRAKPTALYGDVSKEIRDELMNTYVEFAGQSDLAKTFQEPDVQAVTGWRIGGKLGVRTAVFVPVGRDRGDTGRIVLGRRVVRPFTEQQIDLVEIFADQAAIAIANARLFNEIQDKSRQLEVASRHKSEFLANMSHELRTPLNAIIGFSEVLVQGLFGEVNEKQREYLQDVIGSGQHLLSLINDILDLSKIEAGRMELELSTFSFRNALDSGVTIVRERAARHGITLNVDVSDELDQVEADERKVKQILYNLLSNAVKFTPDGGRVEVTVRRDNGDVRVEVRDNGIGIPEEDQARIFEEFQQVGRERSREGTGLGLTLTKRFVELHGGRIWVESAPGQGSMFAFTLPLRQTAPVRA
ncbi:MAG: GAF domain-containing protein [Chloroflexota bacterium]